MVIKMEFHFNYKTTVWDFFRLSIYYIYGSLVGLCNLIFTVAMILLSIKMWSEASYFMRTVLILGCLAFPVIQPIGILQKARKQVSAQKKNVEITFRDDGMWIKADEEQQTIEWNKIKKISKKPGMLIIFSDAVHGYIMTDKVLGQEKEAFYKFIAQKVKDKPKNGRQG